MKMRYIGAGGRSRARESARHQDRTLNLGSTGAVMAEPLYYRRCCGPPGGATGMYSTPGR
jgi:hypothetical protein